MISTAVREMLETFCVTPLGPFAKYVCMVHPATLAKWEEEGISISWHHPAGGQIEIVCRRSFPIGRIEIWGKQEPGQERVERYEIEDVRGGEKWEGWE